MKHVVVLLAILFAAAATASSPQTLVDDSFSMQVAGASLADGTAVVAWIQEEPPSVAVRSVKDGLVSPLSLAFEAPGGSDIYSLTVAAHGDMAALLSVIFPPDHDDNALTGEAYLQLAWKQGEGEWQTDQPAVPVRLSPMPANMGIQPDGTIAILLNGLDGTTLLQGRPGAWSATLLSPTLSMGDLAIGPDGMVHACYGDGFNLVERAGEDVRVIAAGIPGDVYACGITITPEGAGWVTHARPPLIGGGCLIQNICMSAPDAGNYRVAHRTREGAWASTSTPVVFYLLPEMTSTPAGRVLFLHYDSGEGYNVYDVSATGLTRTMTVDAYDASLMQGAAMVVNGTGFHGIYLQHVP